MVYKRYVFRKIISIFSCLFVQTIYHNFFQFYLIWKLGNSFFLSFFFSRFKKKHWISTLNDNVKCVCWEKKKHLIINQKTFRKCKKKNQLRKLIIQTILMMIIILFPTEKMHFFLNHPMWTIWQSIWRQEKNDKKFFVISNLFFFFLFP